MKIGIVSDTHSHKIPEQLVKDFKKVDLIIHAGDFCTKEDFNFFNKLNKLVAVSGNMDEGRLVSKLPRRKIIKVEDVKIGVFHGVGATKDILESVRQEFKNEKCDILIFGHSHRPLKENIDGVLFFNPGSPNCLVKAPYCSYGILEIEGQEIKAEIIKVDH